VGVRAGGGGGGGAAAAAPGDAPDGQDNDSNQPADSLDLDGAAPAYSEEALALLFAERHAEQLRYVDAWGQWLIWNGTVWRVDDTLRVFSLARLLVRQVAASCNKRRVAAKITDAGTVAAIVRLARADRRLAATVAQWDCDPTLLNTPAGVVELRTGAVRAHQTADYMTKIAAVAPGGQCPTWLAFLDRITCGDTALQGFLQRALGYCLTGSVGEHALFFGHGTGGNGKSTFIDTVGDVMGDYHTVAAMETFTYSATDRHPCDLAMLRGARLVTAQETEKGRRWAEGKIKALTGGDPITARFMRQDFFTYMPQFKPFIIGNHRPGLRSVDEAIRRRLHLIPFTAAIPKAEQDKHLPRKLKREWPGILQWMVDGCLAWQREGLAPPPAVKAATDEYLSVIQQWIDECCTLDRSKASHTSALFASFKAWAELRGEFVPTQRSFIGTLGDRGYRQKRDWTGIANRGQHVTVGITLRTGAGAAAP
jgi:putative DNA primase/helicase